MAKKSRAPSGTAERASRAPVGNDRHRVFNDMIGLAELGENIYLVGPSGSGKTTMARQVADHLKVPFHFMSLSSEMGKGDILGYLSPHSGEIVKTPFRLAYEGGGVMLFDEYDAGDPNVQLLLNAAFEADIAYFPDGTVKRHPDFLAIATANTIGSGATRMYMGRNPIDGANFNRFAFLEVGYDQDLERRLAGHDLWVDVIQRIRKSVEELGIKHIVSPRASLRGAAAIRAGKLSVPFILESFVWKGLDPSSIAKIKAHDRKVPELLSEIDRGEDKVPEVPKPKKDAPAKSSPSASDDVGTKSSRTPEPEGDSRADDPRIERKVLSKVFDLPEEVIEKWVAKTLAGVR